jgi:hypothetical protein
MARTQFEPAIIWHCWARIDVDGGGVVAALGLGRTSALGPLLWRPSRGGSTRPGPASSSTASTSVQVVRSNRWAKRLAPSEHNGVLQVLVGQRAGDRPGGSLGVGGCDPKAARSIAGPSQRQALT